MKIISIALLLALLSTLLCAPVTALAEQVFTPLPGPPMDDASWAQLLVGSWCVSPSVGSAYNERWIFTEDALYVLPSQYDEQNEGAMSRSWSVRDGALVCGTLGYTKSYALDGPYQVADDESPYSPKIRIEGRTLYQYAPDPAYFPDLADYGLSIESSVGSPKANDVGPANWWDAIGAPTAAPGATDAPDAPQGALFGPEIADIVANSYGGEAQYAQVGDWIAAYGNCDDHFCVFGWNEHTKEYRILAETNVPGIVPAGAVFVYYGEVKKGKYGWLLKNPDLEKPIDLGLGEMSTVFWSDVDHLYYFTYGKGSSTTYYRMDYTGKNKKKLGTLNGRAVAMTGDGGVVVFSAAKNRVEIWKDGAHTTLYEPEDAIASVVSIGHEIWVSHADRFGLLEDGRLDFQFPGSLRAHIATADHIIALLDDGSIRLRLIALNEALGGYAEVGEVIAQDELAIEVTPGWFNRIVVWGNRESLEFHSPSADQWLFYANRETDSH